MENEVKNDFLDQVAGQGNITTEEMIEKGTEDVRLHEDAVAMMIRELELNVLLDDVIKRSHKLLEPTYEYHKEEEFWLIQEELRALTVKRQMIDMEMKIERSKEIVENKKADLARMKGE